MAEAGGTILITLPGETQPAIEVVFPEHVTALRRGESAAEHLYINRPGDAPVTHASGNSR